MAEQTNTATPAAPNAEEVEYEYVEVPEGDAQQYEETAEYEYVEAPADDIQYEYVEVPEGDAQQYEETAEYEYVEAPAAEAPATEENVEYEYVEAPAAEENVEYEYVEAPAAEAPAAEENVEYEYVEAPAAEASATEENVEYEYVEAPAAEAPATEENVEYEYVEAPAAEAPAAEENVEYEYVEAPAAEAPAAEENVEYEYVEAPATTDETPALPEPELPPEEDELPPPAGMPEEAAPVAAEPALPPEEETPEPAAPAQPEPVAEAVAEPEPDPAPEPADENLPATADELESIAEQASAPIETPQPTTDAPAVSAEELETVEPEPAENTAAIDALADQTVAEAAAHESETAQNTTEETQEEQDPRDADDALPATGAFSFDGALTASFTGAAESDTVVLTNAAHAFDDLSRWYLLISEFSVTPLADQNGAEIPLSDDIFCQGAFINADGSAVPFVNETGLTVPSDNTNLALCGTKVLPMAGQEGATIELEDSAGMLIGPNGVTLMFSHLNKLVVPDVPPVAAQPQTAAPMNAPVAYALPRLNEPAVDAFVFTADDGEKQTDEPAILVKTGYTLYGWNVTFASGLTMSLADVRTFQSKHGVLPEPDGTIGYKQARLTFKNAQSIRVYEKPSYCGYGKRPE